MGGSGEATGTPDPVEKGFATLNSIRYVAKRLHLIIKIPFMRDYTPVLSVAYADKVTRIGVKAMVHKVRCSCLAFAGFFFFCSPSRDMSYELTLVGWRVEESGNIVY
jgi:hypothetical protein